MTEEEQQIKQEAEDFARANKKKIAKRLTDISHYQPDAAPISVFMAGSPGAGKTESSLRLIERLVGIRNKVLRIDSDELRKEFSGYLGQNSHLFQMATSILADKMQDRAISQCQNYIFDGTLSKVGRARENIRRSLSHKRLVQILYVYQDPLQAWKHVQARERIDGRMIPQESFIDQYFQARQSVNILKKEFGNQIQVDLIIKNIDGTDFKYKDNIQRVDDYVPERYTQDTLRSALNTI